MQKDLIAVCGASRPWPPFDREYALALGTTNFDEDSPAPLDKGYFLMLRGNEQLAALSTRFDVASSELVIEDRKGRLVRGNLMQREGRKTIEHFFLNYLGAATKGLPKVVQADGHKFTDASVMSPALMRAVSIINLARSRRSRLPRECRPIR